MIATALSIYLQLDRKFQAYILEKFPGYGVGLTKFEDNPGVREELEKLKDTPKQPKKSMLNLFSSDLGSAPEFIPGGRWFNVRGPYPRNEPLTMEKLRGSVILVDFWTYTCINCIRTLPYLTAWHEKYKDSGLVIVGVHTPEFEFEKNPANVQKAISDFGILYPVVQDNEYATWNAYANRYWPAKYLVDKTGKIRYTHFGEGAYDETETKIQELLKEAGTLAEDMPLDNPEYQVRARTPELYLGYRRVSALASPEHIQHDKPTVYTVPKNLPKNYFAFDGTWTVGDERAMPGKGASLTLHFDAAEVFLVMRPKAEESHVSVSLDGKVIRDEAGDDIVKGIVTVTTDRLYKLIKLTTPGPHILQLNFLDDNLELYAFTFG